jgi:hypothetical protein
MKKLFALLLIAVAAAYYMGFEPSDFIPSFSTSSTPPPKAKRPAQPPPEQAKNPAPVQSSGGGSTVITGTADDGSLEHRWKSYPSSSPAKP